MLFPQNFSFCTGMPCLKEMRKSCKMVGDIGERRTKNMENLIFSLNATVPVFFFMVLGGIFHRLKFMDEDFVAKLNTFVFKILLPVLLFQDLSGISIYQVWDGKFILFCFLVTAVSITLSFGISWLIRKEEIQGEFIQASYRSSAALLGMAFVQNIYGTSTTTPLMIIGTVPLYNAAAVVILSFFRRGERGKHLWKKTLKGIITNPIILGILAGLLWACLGIPQPVIMEKVVDGVGSMATPLGLMAMGAAFEFHSVRENWKEIILCSFLKLVGFVAVFLPVAIGMGFRSESLVAIMVMLGSATTVSCYIMAKNMGHKGDFTSSVVMITTLFSAFTITFWLWLMKSLGYIIV